MSLQIGLVDQTGWEGGRLYVENLARCLLRLPEVERPRVHWFGPQRSLHPDLSSIERHVLRAPRLRATARFEFLAQIAQLGRKLLLDFVHPYPGRLAARGGSAYWIPDLQHRRLPELFSALHRLKRDVAYYAFALTSPRLVLSSEAVLPDYPNRG